MEWLASDIASQSLAWYKLFYSRYKPLVFVRKSKSSIAQLTVIFHSLRDFSVVRMDFTVNTKISVVVPVFNVAPYLTDCMNSLINQTLSEIEIIAVNDGSTDNSLDILRNFSQKDSRIKIIDHPFNMGTAQARNHGLKMANGRYVAFLDGDDYVDNNYYKKLFDASENGSVDIVKALTKTHHVDGRIEIATDNQEIRKNGKYAFIGHLLTAIYKRDMLLRHNIKFHIDFFCFQIQCVYYANKITCIDDTFYNYIRHTDSCDSEVFSLEKWQRLNLGHANYIYNWVKTHEYQEGAKECYLKHVKNLYFYGFNKLRKEDVIAGCHILSDTLKNNFNCGFDTCNVKKLKRVIYRKNKKTNFLDYLLNILKGNI